jgi:hypothetical protein
LPALVLRRAGGVERLEPTATVLGLFSSWECRTAELPLGRQYDVTSDSRRFLRIKRQGLSASRPVVIVQHWAEALKRLVQ